MGGPTARPQEWRESEVITIYLLTLRSGKCYVGQTGLPLSVRLQTHHLRSRTIRAEVLAKTRSLDKADRLEIEWIARQDTLAPSGLNHTTGGTFGWKFSPPKLLQMSRGITKERVRQIVIRAESERP